MCGLWGAVSNYLSSDEIEAVRTLGSISFPRGTDSVGYGYVARQGSYRSNKLMFGMDKAVGDPWGFLYHKDTQKFVRDLMPVRVLMGHNRQATIGQVTEQNAHPFKIEHIIGAHNGTIHSLRPGVNEDVTDSEKLYSMIAAQGLESALQEIHNKGAYALTFLNTNDCTLNIIRNDQRPLYGMYSTSGATLYWASEFAFLEYLKMRNTSGTYKNPFMFKAGILYQIELHKQGIKVNEHELELEPVEVTIVEGNKEPFKREMPKLNDNRIAPVVPDKLAEVEEEEDDPNFFPRGGTLPTLSRGQTTDTLEALHAITQVRGQPQRWLVKQESLDDDILVARLLIPETEGVRRTYAKCITLSTKENERISYINDIKGDKVQQRHLMYMRGDGMFVIPDLMVDLLDVGCIMSKEVVPMYDDAYWLNETEYVSYEYMEDGFIKEYMEGAGNFDAPSVGTLVYVTMQYSNQHNKLIRAIKDGTMTAAATEEPTIN